MARRSRSRTRTTMRRSSRGRTRSLGRRLGRRVKRGVDWKRIAKGAGIGLGISIPLSFIARGRGGLFSNFHEAGQRIAPVAAAKWGGWEGVLGFQVADAIIDRFVTPRYPTIQSGTVGL